MEQTRATIMLSLADVELVDEAKESRGRARAGLGGLRLFLLSVLLGFWIGIAFSVASPARSREASQRARAWLHTTAAEVSSAAHKLVR